MDTSAIIEVLKDTAKSKGIVELIGVEDAAVTVFSVYELMAGIRDAETAKTQGFLTSVKIFNFDATAALESAKAEKALKAKGRKIQGIDVFIAGICMANSAHLVTLDRYFEAVEGLEARIL